MFGVYFLERDPLQLAEFPAGFTTWVQVVGSVAAVCLLVWLPIRLLRGGGTTPVSRPWIPLLFTALVAVSFLGYLALLGLRIPEIIAAIAGKEPEEAASPGRVRLAGLALTVGAGCALLAVFLPVFFNLLDLRWRRILA